MVDSFEDTSSEREAPPRSNSGIKVTEICHFCGFLESKTSFIFVRYAKYMIFINGSYKKSLEVNRDAFLFYAHLDCLVMAHQYYF